MSADNLSKKNPDGTSLGQSATDKVSLFGATPVVQPSVLTPPVSTGSTSSSPFGYTQSQADAIVTWIRAADALFKSLGITAAS